MYSGCYPLYESVEISYELGVIYFFVRNDKQSLENITHDLSCRLKLVFTLIREAVK